MYERFSDRARKVMQLANQEAQRLNNDYVDTVHILLGLCKEGSGTANKVLKNYNVDAEALMKSARDLIPPGQEAIAKGKLPQTPGAKSVILFANEEAMGLGHNYVGTEHLLLGLLREGEGIAFQVLTESGLTLEVARKAVLDILNNTDRIASAPNAELLQTFASGFALPNDTKFRDLAALLAMQGWVVKNGLPTSADAAFNVMRSCYEIADAALKARK